MAKHMIEGISGRRRSIAGLGGRLGGLDQPVSKQDTPFPGHRSGESPGDDSGSKDQQSGSRGGRAGEGSQPSIFKLDEPADGNDKEAMIKKLLDEEMSLMSQSETESDHGSSSLYSDQPDQDLQQGEEGGLPTQRTSVGADLASSQQQIHEPLVYEVPTT